MLYKYSKTIRYFAAIVAASVMLVVVVAGSQATGRAVADSRNSGQKVSCEGVYASVEGRLEGFISRNPGRRIVAFGYDMSESLYGKSRHVSLNRFCIVHEPAR